MPTLWLTNYVQSLADAGITKEKGSLQRLCERACFCIVLTLKVALYNVHIVLCI